ncbi:hypothetical protein [Rickettsiella endosymbiont of Rhagonycha lignosa]|uniref:hypothetical protein n=1 Tax=Rickettsiella endosymbiont of Rhagonycha lignosa TaxID=3077937 RepID=UPI00313D1A6A
MENDRLIVRNYNNADVYYKSEIIVDIFLFFLASWSELGYAVFTNSSVSESILDPLKQYLYPSLSPETSSSITQYLNIASEVFSFTDASLTIATILDIRTKRQKFLKEIKKGFNQIQNGEIKKFAFSFNLLIFSISFIIISLSPWTGLRMRNFSNNFSLPVGISMFIGQITILLLQYADYIFSTPKGMVDFLNLSRDDKKNILHNILCSKKGFGLSLRSAANAITMGLRFHGISLFTNKFLFADSEFRFFYSVIAPVSVVYRVLTAQALKDYRDTFKENNEIQHQILPNNELPLTPVETKNKCKGLLLVLLAGLIGMTFLLRTFSTPVLFTGPIENPENNYGIKDTVFGCFGLLFGAFASFQYCKFMWGLGKEASINISNHSFFRSTGLRATETSINNDAQASYGSIEEDTESLLSEASSRSRLHP